MLKQERQQLILNELKVRGKILTGLLSKELRVSKDTIRRDLDELESKYQLHRVHGGALAIKNKALTYEQRSTLGIDKKIAIAKKAVKLIQSGQVIIISGSTTNLELVKIIPPGINATIFTYSLPIAMELMHHPLLEVIFIGGKMNKEAQVTEGIDVINSVSNIKANICFMGVGGLDLKNGNTEVNWEVAHIKRSMIQASDKVVAMCVSNKLGSTERYSVCPIGKIDTIVTDLNPNDPVFKEWSKTDVKIL